MKQAAWAVMAILSSVALSGCAGLEDFTIGEPQWTGGESWTYTVTGEFSESGAAEGEDFENEEWEEELRVLQVGIPMGSGTGDLLAHGYADDDWWDLLAVDTSQMRYYDAMDMVYGCNAFEACTDALEGQELHIGYGPFPPLHFPLTDDKTWSESQMFGDAATLRARVMGTDSAKTPAGTFADAIQVRYQGKVAESDSYDGYEEAINIDVTWDLWYDEGVQQVVLSELRGTGQVSYREQADGTWQSEQTFAIDVKLTSSLKEYGMFHDGPISNEEILEMFNLGVPTREPYIIVDQEYSGEGDTEVRLSVPYGGFDYPAGTTLQWTVVDAAGQEVGNGTGYSLAVDVPFGGAYQATVDVIYNGTLRTQGDTTFETQHASEFEEMCGAVSLIQDPIPATGQCDPVTFPVAANADRVQVQAVFGDSTGLGEGTVELRDADGTVVATSDTAGDWDLDPREFTTDGRDWQIVYIAESGLETQWSGWVTVSYAPIEPEFALVEVESPTAP